MKNLANTSNNAIRRGFAALLVWSLIFPALFAQSVWTGGAGTTNWNTPGNWTGGVPAAGKTVTINSCSTCPVITTTGNQSAYVVVNSGGKLTIGSSGNLTISNPSGPGMKTKSSTQINVGTGASLTIQGFSGEGLAIGGAFNNNGTVSINGGHTGIAVSSGATLSNAPAGAITVTGTTLNYGLVSSGTVTNQGALTLDDANYDGINHLSGTMNLGGTTNITKTGVNGIFSKKNINHTGTLTIDNANIGIYRLSGGTFTNAVGAKITISGSTSLNIGVFNLPGTFKNNGELIIQNALSKGIENSSSTANFENSGKLSVTGVPTYGIYNVGGSKFTNKPCAFIESNAPIANYATFTNNGIITGPGSGSTSINTNNGTLVGSFNIGSGNAAITETNVKVWTGCSNTNWSEANNWYPSGTPSVSQNPKVIVQNVAQSSGKSPVISSSVGSPPLYLQKNANLTVAAGGTLTCSDANLGSGYLEVGQAATMTVQTGGIVNSSAYGIVSGNLVNSGIINITAPFHSAGNFGVNGGSFMNNAGGQLIGTVGQYGSGVPLGLTNNAVLTNFGSVSISGFGSITLDHSSLTNKPGGTIGIGSSPGEGKITNANGSTFLNQGSLASGDLRTNDSGFTNSGTVQLGSKMPALFGGGATYANSGTINITNGALAVYGGIFNNEGGINVNVSTNDGLVNASTFTNGPTGNISINQTNAYGLLNLLVFKNLGNLNISNSNFEGLNNLDLFENLANGVVTVHQNQPSPWPGLANGAVLVNWGTLNFIGSNHNSIINYSSGDFTNRACAVVNAPGLFHNQNIFKNEGLLKNAYTSSNINSGIFTNTGVLEDFNNSFNGVSYTNNAIRVRPIAGTIGGIIQNALEISGMPPFQIGTTWYKNANLTNPAGSYVNGLNTFTPTVGVGTHTLYFTAKDLVNDCTKTVSIKVSIASPLIGFGGNEDSKILLTNAPNPFSDRTQIKFSLPVDTEAKLVVYDNFGRLVEVIYEGEIIKGELYQFDFNAADKRVGNYMATLILKNGRTFTLQLVKADNR